MRKKIREKIQDEIIRRVLEKEEFLNQQDRETRERAATIEALAEITSLSREEVEDISNSVTAEYKKQTYWIRFIAVIVGVFILAGAGYYLSLFITMLSISMIIISGWTSINRQMNICIKSLRNIQIKGQENFMKKRLIV